MTVPTALLTYSSEARPEVAPVTASLMALSIAPPSCKPEPIASLMALCISSLEARPEVAFSTALLMAVFNSPSCWVRFSFMALLTVSFIPSPVTKPSRSPLVAYKPSAVAWSSKPSVASAIAWLIFPPLFKELFMALSAPEDMASFMLPLSPSSVLIVSSMASLMMPRSPTSASNVSYVKLYIAPLRSTAFVICWLVKL